MARLMQGHLRISANREPYRRGGLALGRTAALVAATALCGAGLVALLEDPAVTVEVFDGEDFGPLPAEGVTVEKADTFLEQLAGELPAEVNVQELELVSSTQADQIAQLRGDILDRDNTISQLRQDVSDRDNKLLAADQLATAANARIEELEKQLAAEIDRIAELEKKVADAADLQAEVDKLEGELAAAKGKPKGAKEKAAS